MAVSLLKLLCLLVILASTATAHGSGSSWSVFPLQIHPLRPKSSSDGHRVTGLWCLGWRLAVETNNIIDWQIPEKCKDYVENYMLGSQYRLDSKLVTQEASSYAQSLKLGGDGKEVWVFDIDETALSNILAAGFGAKPYNATSFNESLKLDNKLLPALPESLKLYKKLLSLGIKIVFLTGRPEDRRTETAANLKDVGYHKWEKLILRTPAYSNKTAVVYKSSERGKLEKEGYRIVGNIGDQWSDLLGTSSGNRTFKLPNPVYYIP